MTAEAINEFKEDDALGPRDESEQLKVYLDGFEGPIDLMLDLARNQKLDLAKISILAIADQYLAFIEQARKVRLELAADYLVMAAWLAYLKSRLLIPEEEQPKNEPSANELAEALAFQLRRLEAMRGVAEQLFGRPQYGINVFGRGIREGLPTEYHSVYDVDLYGILKAYGDINNRKNNAVYKLEPIRLVSLEEAIERLEKIIGRISIDWMTLRSFMPQNIQDPLVERSAVASHFGASLELAKRGMLEIRQETLFAPIYVRRRTGNPNPQVHEDAELEPASAHEDMNDQTIVEENDGKE